MSGYNLSRSNSSATHPSTDTQFNVRNAALVGATSAFLKDAIKPKPPAKPYAGSNGIRIATNPLALGRNHTGPGPTSDPRSAPPRQSLSRQTTGGSVALLTPSPSPQRSNTLGIPSSVGSTRSLSPSNIAASLAAARHSPRVTPRRVPSQASISPPPSLSDGFPPLGTVRDVKARFDASAGDSTPSKASNSSSVRQGGPQNDHDTTPIRPTNSLVKLYEQNSSSQSTTPRAKQAVEPSTTRASTAVPTKTQPGAIDNRPPVPPKSPLARRRASTLSQSRDRESIASLRSCLDGGNDASTTSSYVSAPESPQDVKNRPAVPPPRRGGTVATNTGSTASSLQARPTAERVESMGARTRPVRHPHPPSPPTRPSSTRPTIAARNYQRDSIRHLEPHMTGDSLANAMVGAALATSRNPSPHKHGAVPPPPPSRRSDDKHHHHLPFHKSRTPSPKKPTGMRKTMREVKSDDSDDDTIEGPKKRRFRHPNKHHEGTRKRWRDSVTDRERRRYEGVWAANRGLLQQSPNSSNPLPRELADEVLNIVVRDIWCRSRLPDQVLEEVWDLVDQRSIGRLNRDEFVVGLWLIDQRLKGRKLPTKVGQSVWDSVGLLGVRVKVRK